MAFDNIVKEYKTQSGESAKYRFPDHDLNPAEKRRMEYFVNCCKYLFYLDCNDMTLLGISNGNKYTELRKYAEGRITGDKYKPVLLGKEADGSTRDKSFMNISWEPDLGYMKTLDQMIGGFQNSDYDITVKAIDPDSDFERSVIRAGIKLDSSPDYIQFAQEVGVNLPKSEHPKFESDEEMELYEKAGGLKLKTEISMQKAINCTRQMSGYKVLEQRIFRDLRDIGIACMREYVDYSTSTVMIRYVDVENLIVPFSKYEDFRDVTMAAEKRVMTIADIRNESDLSENELMQIAVRYGYNGRNYDMSKRIEYSASKGMPYDHVQVIVLDAQWLSSDLEKYTEKHIDKYGTLEFKRRNGEYDLPKSEANKGKSMNEYRIQFTYKCMWIVGTEYCFNYGKDYYQARVGKEGNKKAFLSFHIVSLGQVSKLKRIIGDIDDINILTFKRRNAVASIPAPPGIIVNKSALEDVEMDGQVKTPKDIMNMFLEKGVLAIDSKDMFGRHDESINNVITTFSSNLFEQFRIFSEQIEEKRRNIQLATGINDVVDGSSENQRRLRVEGEAKLQAANNAMQPEYTAVKTLLEKTFQGVMYRWQEIVKHEDVTLEYTPLGTEDIEVIKLTADISKAKFGLKVDTASTMQERELLLQDILSMKQSRSENGGSGGISEETYIKLYRVIREGNIPLAQLLVAKAKKQQEQEDMQRSMMLQQQNAEVQAQASQVSEKEKRKTMFAKAATELILQNAKAKDQAALEVLKVDLQDGQLDDELMRAAVQQAIAGNDEQLQRLQAIIMGDQQQGMGGGELSPEMDEMDEMGGLVGDDMDGFM